MIKLIRIGRICIYDCRGLGIILMKVNIKLACRYGVKSTAAVIEVSLCCNMMEECQVIAQNSERGLLFKLVGTAAVKWIFLLEIGDNYNCFNSWPSLTRSMKYTNDDAFESNLGLSREDQFLCTGFQKDEGSPHFLWLHCHWCLSPITAWDMKAPEAPKP